MGAPPCIVTLNSVCGALAGLNFFLGFALIVIIAANGTSNPAMKRAGLPAGAGSTTSAPTPLPDGSFQALDLDGDGSISLAEAAGHPEIVVRFDRADRDRDGQLSESEFAGLAKLPPPKPIRGPGIRRADANPTGGGA